MSGLWDTPGVPHLDWTCVDVIDLREDGGVTDDPQANYEVCQMCGQENIRFAHIMTHPSYEGEILAGCICAGKMSGDYIGAKAREAKARNLALRRSKWLTRKWRTSSNGNQYLRQNGYHFLVFKDKNRDNAWKWKFDDDWGRKSFSSIDSAKLALFDYSASLIDEED